VNRLLALRRAARFASENPAFFAVRRQVAYHDPEYKARTIRMIEPVVTAIVALGLLQFKHFLCDFVFQTNRQFQFKGVYGHPAGLEHSAIHAVGTVPCLLIVAVPLTGTLIIAAVEFVIHYHVDWIKEQVGRRAGWTPAMRPFWTALGLDQLVHQATYLAIVAAISMTGKNFLLS
jgi:hypothetical protein